MSFLIYYLRVTNCLPETKYKQILNEIVLNKALSRRGTPYEMLLGLSKAA